MLNNTNNKDASRNQPAEEQFPKNLLEAFFHSIWHLNPFVKTAILLIVFIPVGFYLIFNALPDKAKTDIWEYFWNPESHNVTHPPTESGGHRLGSLPSSGIANDTKDSNSAKNNQTAATKANVHTIPKLPNTKKEPRESQSASRPVRKLDKPTFSGPSSNGLIIVNDVKWGEDSNHNYIILTYTVIADTIKPLSSVLELNIYSENGECRQQPLLLPPVETLAKGAYRQQIIGPLLNSSYVEMKFNNSIK